MECLQLFMMQDQISDPKPLITISERIKKVLAELYESQANSQRKSKMYLKR